MSDPKQSNGGQATLVAPSGTPTPQPGVAAQSAALFADRFAGQNSLITPAALARGEAAPSTVAAQKFVLVLSGVVIVDLKGATSADWRHETVHILPDLAGPLNYAINRHAIPRPPGNGYYLAFETEQWSPFAAISSLYDQNQAVNAGFAVDTWRAAPFGTGEDAVTGQPIRQLFSGIHVDVAVRDSDAWLYRLSYNITLLGRIRFGRVVIP